MQVSWLGYRNKPRRVYAYPTSHYPEHVRAAIFRRRAWEAQRDRRLERLHSGAVQNRRGDLYRYLQAAWLYMHPHYEWPEFLREQNERLAWLHHRYDCSHRPWERVGPPINPRIVPYLDPKDIEAILLSPIFVARASSGGGGGGGGSPVAGAYAVDVANISGVASDSNDGIWDSDGPWATWGKLATEIAAGTFSVGDTIYLRAGTYSPSAELKFEGGGSTINSSKITLESWPGETATIDFSTNDDRTMLDGSTGTGPCNISSGNWRIRNLDFVSYIYGFALDANVACPGVEFIDLRRTRFGTATSSGNIAVTIAINEGGNSTGFLVEGCDLSDGNELNGGNGGTMYLIHTWGTIRNNIIAASGTAGGACHCKRLNVPSALGDLTVENNIFHRESGYTRCITAHNFDWVLLQNNVFSGDNNDSIVYGTEDGTHPPNGYPWYRANVLHNTFRVNGTCSGVGAQFHMDAPAVDGFSGYDCVLQDNVFEGTVNNNGGNTAKTHGFTMDYNLHSTATTNTYREFSSTAGDLSATQALTTYFGGSHSLNSEEEAIAWDTALSVYDPQTYRLDATSLGFGTASDATDMGADVDNVGPVALGY